MAVSPPNFPGPPLRHGRWLIELTAVLLPLAIMVLGALLLVSHRRAWQAARTPEVEPQELKFQRRRYRRRMQTSGILVALGAAMLAGQTIAADKQPSLFVCFWCVVALLALCMIALALRDVIATRLHLQSQLRQQVVERAKLQAELNRIKKANREDAAESADD